MPGTRAFKQVDVFTRAPLKGNPLAVVLGADGMSEAQMHAIARWTNLSETTFALAPTTPEADYRVRIFSPGTEFAFAGHPTLGTAHALLEAGLVPRTPGRLVQECGVGLVALSIGADGALAFRSPPAELRQLHGAMRPALAATLGTSEFGEAVIATMGISWLVVRMHSAAACLAVKVDPGALRTLVQQGVTGVAMFGAHEAKGVADYEVRAVFTKMGELTEDPVTGSANACIARVLQAQGFPDGRDSSTGYSARQGTLLGCDGRISVRYVEDEPWIGGYCVTVIDGAIRL